MDTRRTPRSPGDSAFWREAFTAATWSILLAHDGKQLTPVGAAHLCAEYADAAVAELQQRRAK